MYQSFLRVLKPVGMLLIYDANWHAHFYDEALMKKVRAREEAHFRKYGTREIVSEDDMEFLNTCPMTRQRRPEWDEGVLSRLGLREIQVERFDKPWQDPDTGETQSLTLTFCLSGIK